MTWRKSHDKPRKSRHRHQTYQEYLDKRSKLVPSIDGIEAYFKEKDFHPDMTVQKSRPGWLFPNGNLYFIDVMHNQSAVAAMFEAGYPDSEIHMDTMMNMGIVRVELNPKKMLDVETFTPLTQAQARSLKPYADEVEHITWDIGDPQDGNRKSGGSPNFQDFLMKVQRNLGKAK